MKSYLSQWVRILAEVIACQAVLGVAIFSIGYIALQACKLVGSFMGVTN